MAEEKNAGAAAIEAFERGGFLMQEAVEEKTINLAVSMSKLSWRAIVGAVRAYMA